MTLAAMLDDRSREDAHYIMMKGDPVLTLARVMDHLAKEPSLPTGDAIRLVGKLQGKLRKERGNGKM